MKRIAKKLLALLMASVMTFGLLPASELAGINFNGLFSVTGEAVADDEVGSYPLDVVICSNKTNYGAIDTATFTVTIKNISTSSVSDISSECSLNGLSPIGKNNTYYIDNVTLKPGESASYSYNATINPNSLNFLLKFILQIKRFFSGSQTVPEMNFEDGRNKTAGDITVKFSSEEVTETVFVWYQYDTEIIRQKLPRLLTIHIIPKTLIWMMLLKTHIIHAELLQSAEALKILISIHLIVTLWSHAMTE